MWEDIGQSSCTVKFEMQIVNCTKRVSFSQDHKIIIIGVQYSDFGANAWCA